jgi:ectoine hydroxylase-related dioxygenase (phytanoyl-CoA dioxygenase family)
MGIGQLAYKLHQAYVDHVVTGPNPLYRPSFGRELNLKEVSTMVDDLRRDGVTDIENYADRNLAARLSAQMDAAAAGSHPSTGTIYSDVVNYHVVEKPLRLGTEILHLATHPLALAVIERYLRHRVYLADVDARIIPPTRIENIETNLLQKGQKKTASSSHWHRDARGRQVKLMAYLSDVGKDDTRFAFLPFTHKNVPLRPTFDETRFSDEEVSKMQLAPVEWLAPAGSAKLFDTNLIHRLMRKPTGTVRYSVTFYYTPGQHLRELAVNSDDFESLSREQRGVLKGGEADRIKFG